MENLCLFTKKKPAEGQQLYTLGRSRYKGYIAHYTHTMHVWYMYLHFKHQPNIGKYTIHPWICMGFFPHDPWTPTKNQFFTHHLPRFVTEVVQGIRVAKLYAWEEAIFTRPIRIHGDLTRPIFTQMVGGLV